MDYNILFSQGINPSDCSKVEMLNNDNETLLFVRLKANQRKCIFCNFSNCKIKEYKNKTIKSLPTGKNITYIYFSLPRYKCPNCNKTFTHNLHLYATNSISKIMKNRMMEKFATICSYKSIAKEYNLSLTETINVFDESCPDLRIPITEAICIDEFSNIRKDDFKFACIIIDFYSHKIIDILKSRQTPYLDEYFSQIPLKTREKVKYVITDMYDGYISAAKRWFHNATIAIDPFHYMEYLTEAVQSIRRRVLDDESKYYRDRSWMGKHWRLLTTNPKNFPSGKMVLKNGMTISYYDRVLRFIKQNKELEYAFMTVQSIYYQMERLNINTARSFFESTIFSLKNSTIKEFIKCGQTWENYKDLIINSFIKYKDVRLSNGPIEGINKRVKELKNVMSGYHNSNRFYQRIIYIQNSNKKGR